MRLTVYRVGMRAHLEFWRIAVTTAAISWFRSRAILCEAYISAMKLAQTLSVEGLIG